MTQTSNLKSLSITNMDATPVIPVSTGEGKDAELRVVNDWVAPLSGDSTSSTYKLCRFPTYAKVKHVILYSTIATAGSGDLNVVFSDSTVDGTPANLQGTIPQISSANNKLFGAATSLVGIAQKDMVFLGSFTPANSQQHLWEVLGYTVDPGGFFDIQVNITTQVTTGGLLNIEVQYAV